LLNDNDSDNNSNNNNNVSIFERSFAVFFSSWKYLRIWTICRHRIISKKKTGFISGIQRTKDGDIEWDRELPRTCNLSRCVMYQSMMITLLVLITPEVLLFDVILTPDSSA